ncbi:hypothetical protein [Mycolicibacterium sp. 624]
MTAPAGTVKALPDLIDCATQNNDDPDEANSNQPEADRPVPAHVAESL